MKPAGLRQADRGTAIITPEVIREADVVVISICFATDLPAIGIGFVGKIEAVKPVIGTCQSQACLHAPGRRLQRLFEVSDSIAEITGFVTGLGCCQLAARRNARNMRGKCLSWSCVSVLTAACRQKCDSHHHNERPTARCRVPPTPLRFHCHFCPGPFFFQIPRTLPSLCPDKFTACGCLAHQS